MSKTNFYFEPLKKHFTLKFSNKNVLASQEFQLKTTPEDTDDGEDFDATDFRKIQQQRVATTKLFVSYPADVLNLTDTQVKKLWDVDQDELSIADNLLSMTLQKYPKDVIEGWKKAVEEPSKSDDEKVESKASDKKWLTSL